MRKILVLVACLLLLAIGIVGTLRSVYPCAMVIESISGDCVSMVTASGLCFEMCGAEDYEVGDIVSVLMFSRGTEKVTDDAIIAARWSGWTREDMAR